MVDAYVLGWFIGFYLGIIIQLALTIIALYFSLKEKHKIWSWILLINMGFVVFKTYWENWNWFIPYLVPLIYFGYYFFKKKVKIVDE